MKHILILFIFAYGNLYALDVNSTLKIYHKLFFSFSNKIIISVYVNDKEYQQVFLKSKRLKVVKKLKNADIVLITDEVTLERTLSQYKNLDIDTKPILFVTDYHFLNRSKNIVGAFYWRKGRSQLLFIKSRLNAYNIMLPEDYHKFIVDEL